MPFVTVKQLAEELNHDRSSLRKYLIKNGFQLHRVRTPASRGQETLALTAEDAELVRATLQSEGYVASSSASPHGYFYAIQVVPELAPNRVKLGWASDVQARLAAHRTAAPTAALLKSWPCRQRWEFTAIDSATRTGCKALLNEVFECDSLDALVGRVDAFFAIMPEVTKATEIPGP